MTERLAESDHEPHDGHLRVYTRWVGSGAGLLVTGNVMIDRDHLEAPGNVVADAQSRASSFRRWAQAAQSPTCHVWMQLSHPGRQSPKMINGQPVSASPIPARDLNYFAVPRALEDHEINDILWRFGQAAAFAKATGFQGV